MAGTIRIRIGANRLPDIARILPEAADVVVNRKHGPAMAEGAARRSRVDTGEMRDGWRWEATGRGTGQLINEVDHTVYNEYGTRNMSAQPMARPAFEEEAPQIIEDFERLEAMLR